MLGLDIMIFFKRLSLVPFFLSSLLSGNSAVAAVLHSTHTCTPTHTGFIMEIVTSLEDVRYEWVAPPVGAEYSVGSLVITDTVNGQSSQQQISLASKIDWVGPGSKLQSAAAPVNGAIGETLTYFGPSGTTHLTVSPVIDGLFAGLKFNADKPNMQDIYMGVLPAGTQTSAISVPYYSQAVNYLSSLNLFENSYFDPFDSRATTLSNSSAPETFYGPNESGTYNALADIWKVSVSNSIVNVMPYPEHPASPYMNSLAGRLFLDVPGGSFASIASELAILGDYGVNNCVATIGDWQDYGYDNALPAQYPASSALGGDAGMRDVSNAALANSCFFALHENYADYYPNFPGYTPAATMRKLDGTQMISWFNPVTGLTAFATKPALFIPFAQTQSPYIHNQYGTNSSFLDVNSSATPYWRTDRDPATVGSGMFAPYRDDSIALWAYERGVEGGPVFGEGKDHWFWSGLLDGVEAQFGAEATPITNGLTAPLFVDFDLTRIHPLQVNYGMGYYSRWLPGGATITTETQLDAYRMQEAVFGHAPYLTDALWDSVPRTLLEQNLLGQFASRNALQTPSSVSYLVNGAWTDASGAAKAGNFSVAQVSYPNGDNIFANSSTSTLTWNSLQIPQYGWAVKGNDYLAYTALVGGQATDYSQSSQAIYANARNQADILSDQTLATPEVVELNQIAPRTVQIQLAWDVNEPTTTDYTEFIHFVSTALPWNSNSVSTVTSSNLGAPTSTWAVGQRVVDQVLNFQFPSTLADGSYQVRVGLFSGSTRATLYGNSDSNFRYVVGTVTLSNNGSVITFTNAPIVITSPDPRLNSAGNVVDFGTLRTDGMVNLQNQTNGGSTSLRLSSYPRSRDVVIQFNPSAIPMPASMTCDTGDVIVPSSVAGGYWSVDLRGRKYCSWQGTLQ